MLSLVLSPAHEFSALNGIAIMPGFDATTVFSITSALFSAMDAWQTSYFQWLAHSFPSHGGGGERTNVRSIRASGEDASPVYPRASRGLPRASRGAINGESRDLSSRMRFCAARASG